MQAQVQKQERRVRIVAKRVASSYTCPRCRAYNKTIGCTHCGWTPDTSVAFAGADISRDDRIVCC